MYFICLNKCKKYITDVSNMYETYRRHGCPYKELLIYFTCMNPYFAYNYVIIYHRYIKSTN